MENFCAAVPLSVCYSMADTGILINIDHVVLYVTLMADAADK